jgi:uncharacterized protein YgfB (UPF0149 family)
MTQHKNKLPNYKEFQEALTQLRTEMSPAEYQGIAFGLLAWNNHSRAAQEWSTLLAEECETLDESTRTCQNWLAALFECANHGLKDTNFGLRLYLPSDDIPIHLRALAVSQWCRGFMFGLGLMGFDSRMLSNVLINEALQDISQIMNIETHPDENTTDCEKEYFELVEYLRMATLLIYSEITGVDQGGGKSAHGFH